MATIRGLCEGDGIRGRGEIAQSVVASDSCGTEAEDHSKRDFGSSVGAAEIVIWKVW